MTGSWGDGPSEPAFYFDLSSPEAYLAAERVLRDLPVRAEWHPVWSAALPEGALTPGDGDALDRSALEGLGAERGLLPFRWPQPLPSDTRWAMLVATFAKQIGRTVPFAHAAFRQAFAGGRDLGDRDHVLISAAACEMHPTAVVKSAGLGSIADRLDAATEAAIARGVTRVPAVALDGEVFHGDAGIEAAARHAAVARSPA